MNSKWREKGKRAPEYITRQRKKSEQKMPRKLVGATHTYQSEEKRIPLKQKGVWLRKADRQAGRRVAGNG